MKNKSYVITINQELHQRLKLYTVNKQQTMGEVIEKAVTTYLNKKETK